MIGLNYRNRDLLYEKINLRVEKMFEMGLLQEAENLRSVNIGKTAYQAIGYKELEKFFNGDASLPDVMEEIKQKTRRYAKRQLTWFKKEKRINWVYLDDYQNFQEILQEAKKIVEEFDLM
jgi:tRNA dimethylallyltransferase